MFSLLLKKDGFKCANIFLKSLGNVTINLQTDGFTSFQDEGVSCMVLVHPTGPWCKKNKEHLQNVVEDVVQLFTTYYRV